MATKKYLDEIGLADVAGHVNSRLKTVSTMPVTADLNAVRLYTGEDTQTYKKGHIYQMAATEQNFLQFSADTTTYFMSEDGTITSAAPTSFTPQVENVPFTDTSTGATLVYMAGNNALVQKLENDVNVITVNFNKIKTSVMPWWTAGAATGSYNPFTIRNVQLVAVTAWVDITSGGGIKTVTVMPENPSDKDVVIYTGESGMVYEQNHIYQYDLAEDEWIDITAVIPDEEAREVATGAMALAEEAFETSTKIWKGSEADWDLLPISEKIKYDYVAFDEEDDPITAATLPYDNTESGVVSTNVQGAIDEVVSTTNTKLEALDEKFQTGFYIFISDSYNDGAYDPNPDHKGWISQCAERLGLTVNDWTNQAQSGGSFQAGTWLAKLTSYRESITQEHANSVTKIVIGGGINDCLTDGVNNYSDEPSVEAYLTKLYNAIGAVSQYCAANYPNALIYFCPVGYAWESSPVLYGRGVLSRFVCYNYMRSAMSDFGNYVCPTHTEFILHEKTLLYSGDLLHPNNTGCVVIARGIAQAIRTGTCDVMFSKHVLSLTPASGLEVQHNSSYEYIINENAYLVLNMAINATSPVTLTSSDFTLGTLDLDLTQGNAFDMTDPLIVDITLQSSTGNINTRGYVTIYPGGELKIHFEDIDPSSWAFKSYSWSGYMNIRSGIKMISSRLC